MADGWGLLLDLVITLSSAVLLGLLAERLRQSAVVGYLLAGILISPQSTGWVRSADAVHALAEIGVALLLFTIGLEFSFRRLRRMGAIALGGGTLQIGLCLGAAMALAMAFGAPLGAAYAVGAAFALSSTAVVLRVLKERSELESLHGKNALAMLLLQDLALLPLMFGVLAFSEGRGAPDWVDLGDAAFRAGTIVAAMLLLLLVVLPRLLSVAAIAQNRELPILFAIVACIGATWAAHGIGLSPALGAFFAGVLLAESRFADQVRADVLPLRALFTTVFFASVGMLADVRWIADHAGLVLLAAAGLVVLKTLLAALAVRAFQPSWLVAAATGLALGQMGEFSFVIAGMAQRTGLVDQTLFQLVVSVSVLSLVLASIIVPKAARIGRRLCILVIPTKVLAAADRKLHARPAGEPHILLVGYGDAGQATASRLRDEGWAVTVLDANPFFADLARKNGFVGRIGDATQSENLIEAGVTSAATVAVAVPDARTARMILSQCKTVAPHVPIAARSRYHQFVDELDVAGADLVVDEEGTTGHLLADAALRLAPSLELRERARDA